MRWAALLAQVKRDPFREPEVIWGTAGIAVALLVGAFAIWVVERWRKNATAKREAVEELSDYRGMFQRGEITEDEYAKLRSKVATRVRAEVARPAEAGAGGATGEIPPPGGVPPTPPGDGSRGPPV